jgi:hypothetical protein
MLEIPTFLIILAAGVISFISMPLVIKIAYKLGAVDKPEARKVHQHTMPRLGGLAMYLSFMICIILFVGAQGPFTGLLLGASIVFSVGMLDDIFQLSPWVKLLGQCAAAVVAMYFGVVVEFLTNPFDGMLNLGYFSLPLTFLWIVGVSNAINLIDGLDGLAGGVSAIAAITMGVVALVEGQAAVAICAFILAAGIGGFLPYNFYPAKTFMGDGGSNFLGDLGRHIQRPFLTIYRRLGRADGQDYGSIAFYSSYRTGIIIPIHLGSQSLKDGPQGNHSPAVFYDWFHIKIQFFPVQVYHWILIAAHRSLYIRISTLFT